ncbi:ATP-binding protein, partial [Mycoplasma sp. 1012]
MDLKKYIGETSFCEKKVMLEENKVTNWLKTVVAFANTKGGKIIFGIDDNDRFVGLVNAKKDSEKISEIIKTKLDPIPDIELTIEKYENKDFIILTISPGNETPYYIIDNGNRKIFVRIGNQSVSANYVQMKNLVLKGSNKTFDSIDSNIKSENASFSKLKAVYFQKTGQNLNDSDLLSFSLINEKGNLTFAGALLADDYFVYQSRVFATRWNGLDKANSRLEALDDKEFQGSILYLLQSAEEFINSNYKKMWKKTDVSRIEYPDYPEIAIRESIVNALIHRDYTEKGSEIHIDIYDDRLEIYSPGGMSDGSLIQEQNIYQIASKRRNPIIADVFSRLNLMERRGSGLKKIIESYKKQENYNEKLIPQFISNTSSFFIVLKNLNYNTQNKVAINGYSGDKNDDKVAINEQSGDKNDDKVAINGYNGDKSNDKVAINGQSGDKNNDKVAINGQSGDKIQELIVLNFAKQQEEFKSKDIEKLLNIKSSRVRKILLNMINSHKLESVGENKNRKYKLKNKKHNKDLKNVKNDANKENKNLDQELIVLNFAKQQEEFKSK